MNAGMPWPSLELAEARVLGIQRKLHKWASEDQDRRFSDLHNLVCDPATLLVACSDRLLWHAAEARHYSTDFLIAAGLLSLWFDLLTFAIPMNLGTLEGSRILVFKALGCEGLLGMAFGVAVRIAQVFWACFGLANYIWLATRQAGAMAGRPWASLARVATRATELQQGMRELRTNDP